jgi:hypothetical protein
MGMGTGTGTGTEQAALQPATAIAAIHAAR